MKGAALRSVLPYESIKELLMLTVFFTTAADPSLVLQMMPYRISSFRAEVRMLYENEEKSQHDTERRIYYTDDALPSYTRIMELAVRRSCWRT